MPKPGRSKLQPQLRRPQINRKILENGVRSALNAGWEPLSRGKPLNVHVTAEGLPLEQPPVLP
jgi:hypothetical protein